MASGLGFVACLIAGLCFGSNFLPVKQFEVGDGIFFQWVMCCGIWIVGLITVGFEDDRSVHTIAMLGGMLWCVGNVLCVQVIRLIGMSMGLMIWGITNSLMGWFSGKFGLFGIRKEGIDDPTMNYIGLSLTVVSLALFSHVKPSSKAQKVAPTKERVTSATDSYTLMADQLEDGDEPKPTEEQDWTEKLSPFARRVIGFSLACGCGLLFGLSFNPAQYERNHGGNDRMFDYVFSHFCGIFATSTAIMLAYCAYKRNNPVINNRLVLPAFTSGVIWAIAQVCWFIAIQNLDMVVANPIVTTIPSVVAGLWGILLFKEIEGIRNLSLFVGGLVIASVGVVLVALSA